MSQRTFVDEARDCLVWAAELKGSSEEAFLLRLADEFSRLAFMRLEPSSFSAADRSYYARRSAEERRAASSAAHPQAQAAHLAMAEHYRRISKAEPPAAADSIAGHVGFAA